MVFSLALVTNITHEKKMKWIRRLGWLLLISSLFSCSLLLDYGDPEKNTCTPETTQEHCRQNCSSESWVDQCGQQSEACECPSVDLPGYQLVGSDEFNGTELDTSKWTVNAEEWGNATNSASAVSVADGLLTITAYTEDGKHFAGLVESSGAVLFGFIEARVRFQSSPGVAAAFWLQSYQNGEPVGDPATDGAAIAIAQHLAVDKDGSDAYKMVDVSVQWDVYGDNENEKWDGFSVIRPESFNGVWHTWAVLWTDKGYEFYMDGVKQWMTSNGLSKHEEHLCFSSVVSDWTGPVPSGGFGSLEDSTTKMEVDWVRVWQKP